MRWKKHKLALLALTWLVAQTSFGALEAAAQEAKKPNIVIIWGDDIGQSNISGVTRTA